MYTLPENIVNVSRRILSVNSIGRMISGDEFTLLTVAAPGSAVIRSGRINQTSDEARIALKMTSL